MSKAYRLLLIIFLLNTPIFPSDELFFTRDPYSSNGAPVTFVYDMAITGSLIINGALVVDGGLTLNGGSIPGVSATELIATKGDISGPGMFNSINDAMNSITDASSIKPYTIRVGPGIFTESTITMKPYTHIVGNSQFASIINASDPTQNLIIGASLATVENCTLQGVTGAGAAAIYYNQPGYFRVISCRFGRNYTFILQGGTPYPPGSATVVTLCSANYDSYPTTAFSVNNHTSPYLSGLLLADFIWQPLTIQPQLNAFIEIQGNCVSLAADTLIGAPLPLSLNIGGCAFRAYDGATLRLNDCSACGFTTGVHIPNLGNGASLRVTDLLCENNTMDVVVSTTAAIGILSGQFSKSRTSIAAGAPLSILMQDYVGGSLINSGAFYTSSTNVNGNSTTAGTLFTGNIAQLHTDLSVGGSTSIIGDLNVNVNQFKVTASNGNINTAGRLDTYGASQAHASLDVTGTTRMTGNATLMGTLAVTGNTTLTGNLTEAGTSDFFGASTVHNALTVTGSTSFDSTANVTGNFSVNMNKFNITAASGNTAISGRLMVGGDLTNTHTTHLFDVKVTTTIPASSVGATPVLRLTFQDFLGQNGTLRKGAYVKFTITISGIQGAFLQSGTSGQYYATVEQFIVPGQTTSSAPIITNISNTVTPINTTGILPNSISISTPTVGGTGKNATIYLGTSGLASPINNQNTVIFYEVMSDNLAYVV